MAVMGENVEYNNLPEEEKARCRAFVEAWRNMADRNSVEAVEERFSDDELDGLTVADLRRQRAENNLKTTGDEEMESKEEDEGGTSPVANNNDSSEEETLGVLEKVKAQGSGG